MHLIHVEFHRVLSRIVYLPVVLSTPAPYETAGNSRSDNCTKPSTFHGNACIRPSAHCHNFITNVFPLSITVRPNHQGLCASGLQLQVLLDVLLIGRDGDLDRRFEETEWITTVPGLERRTEVLIHKMSSDRSDGILGSSLRVVEIIVLDVLGGSVALAKV